MTLLLRCVSAGIELRCHLGHAYIISNTLYTGCTAVVVGSTYPANTEPKRNVSRKSSEGFVIMDVFWTFWRR